MISGFETIIHQVLLDETNQKVRYVTYDANGQKNTASVAYVMKNLFPKRFNDFF